MNILYIYIYIYTREKGRYRYAGQWKHSRMHGCGVYEVNEKTIYVCANLIAEAQLNYYLGYMQCIKKKNIKIGNSLMKTEKSNWTRVPLV